MCFCFTCRGRLPCSSLYPKAVFVGCRERNQHCFNFHPGFRRNQGRLELYSRTPVHLEQPHYSKEWTFCARSHRQLCIKHTRVQTCSPCALWRGFCFTRPSSNRAAGSPSQKLTLQLHSPGFVAEPLAEKLFGQLKHLYSARVKSKHTCIAELALRWDQNCMWFHNRVKIGTEWSHAKSKASPPVTQGSKGGGGINMWREGRYSHSPSHKCRAATPVQVTIIRMVKIR